MTNLSSLVEAIAKQALGGQQQNQQSSGTGGLGGILGSVLSQVLNQNENSAQPNQQKNSDSNGQQNNQKTQQQHSNQHDQMNSNSQSGLGGLGSVLSSVLGQLGQGGGSVGSGGLADAAKSAATGGSKTALLIAVLPIILAWIQKQGGIQGALDKLKQAGLTSQVQSWVNPNAAQNDTIKEEQVQQLFDEEDISKVAAQTHEPKQNVYSAIATVLPQIIDSLTPNGDKTSNKEADSDVQNVLNSISNLLSRK